MHPSFRIATEGDAELLLAMMREYYAYDGHAFDEPKARVALLTFLRESSFGVPGSSANGKFPWATSCSRSDTAWNISAAMRLSTSSISVNPIEGAGGDARLWKFVEHEARASEVRLIHLEVVRKNRAAKEVYRRAGYADHDHYLMSKWIERSFAKPGAGSH